MEKIAQAPVLNHRASLIDAITSVHVEFAHMKDELEAAHREIARLKQRLSPGRPPRNPIGDIDLPSLRRHVAFYCHPDRAGDGDLMRRLNVLFDYLEHSQASATAR